MITPLPLLTYDGHTGHLQHISASMSHMSLRLAPPGYESLAAHQAYGILWQANGQYVLTESCGMCQLEQRQIITIRLCDAKVKARMNDLLQHAVLLYGQRLVYVTQILCVQFTQIYRYVRQLCLLYAMRCRGHHVRRDEHTAALILCNAYVRQPWILTKLRWSAANDALLQRVLCGARQAALRLKEGREEEKTVKN